MISGYLMTGIIFTGLTRNKFSLLNFYMARANRIIPALAVLCMLLLVLGWFLLTPPDYRMLGKHALSSMAFLSNIVYWQETGYFDVSSHSKWLLHTWSLSVEWQFYIVYPLVLLLLNKLLSAKNLKYAILILLLASFVGNIYLTRFFESSAFYLFPTRAWELLLGGVAFLFPVRLSDKYKKAVEVLGLCLIALSYVFISKQDAWPGYHVLASVIGAYLVITSNYQKSVVTNNIVFQKIGTWSYSIYLWHWPLAVINFMYLEGAAWTCVGLLLSVFLGYLSHKYIESINFDRKVVGFVGVMKSKPVLLFFVVAIAAGVINSERGFEFRLDEKDKKILNPKESVVSYFSESMIELETEECRLYEAGGIDFYTGCDKLDVEQSEIDLIIIGDSHGGAISPSVLLSLVNTKGGGKILNLRASGCIPLKGIEHRNDAIFSNCNEYNKYIFKELETKYAGVPVLVLARLNLYLYGFNENGEVGKPFIWIDGIKEYGGKFMQIFKDRFVGNMCELSRNHPLYILKPVPEVGVNVPNKMLANYMVGVTKDIQVSYESYQDRNAGTEKILSDLNRACNATILTPLPYLDVKGGYMASKNGESLYRDSNHLNLLGGKIISPVFDQIW